ncbi:MAG: hypothetical protein HY553_23145 [Elusimicrobia bacterium]|nr:hypothetical protein [Elusimicrobiota bacterium]
MSEAEAFAPASAPPVALPTYRLTWAALFALALIVVWWSTWGSARARRRGLAASAVAEAARTDLHFIVAAFPRITPHGKDSTIRHEAFGEIVAELRRRGYHAIGFADLDDLYAGRRRLPPRSILLAFERDNPESVRLVERVLRRVDWRAAVFQDRSGVSRKDNDIRRALSSHAMNQMLLGGAWDFGTAIMPGSVRPVEGPGRDAVIWGLTPRRVQVPGGVRYGLQLSKTGYNDADVAPRELRAFIVRPEASVNETIAAIEALQPRAEPFADFFRGERLGPDWVSEWGVIAGNKERLAVLPQPNQRTAVASLKGTDRWTDAVLEFSILRYRGEAWAEARAREPERWVRLGLENDIWRLQQKTADKAKPVTLAQAPLRGELGVPVKLVLKGNWALALIGDRLQFGRGVWLDDALSFGRVQFVAQGARPGSSKAVFGFVRARPLEERWLAFDRAPDVSPELLGSLRAQAVEARVLAPRWIVVGARGSVRVLPPDELTRSLAGFYRCRLIPTAVFNGWPRPQDFRATAEGLAAVAEALNVPGVNLRLPPDTPGASGLARELRAALWRRHRLLWVTVRNDAQARQWADDAEQVLSSHGTDASGVETLRRREP